MHQCKKVRSSACEYVYVWWCYVGRAILSSSTLYDWFGWLLLCCNFFGGFLYAELPLPLAADYGWGCSLSDASRVSIDIVSAFTYCQHLHRVRIYIMSAFILCQHLYCVSILGVAAFSSWYQVSMVNCTKTARSAGETRSTHGRVLVSHRYLHGVLVRRAVLLLRRHHRA